MSLTDRSKQTEQHQISTSVSMNSQPLLAEAQNQLELVVQTPSQLMAGHLEEAAC